MCLLEIFYIKNFLIANLEMMQFKVLFQNICRIMYIYSLYLWCNYVFFQSTGILRVILKCDYASIYISTRSVPWYEVFGLSKPPQLVQHKYTTIMISLLFDGLLFLVLIIHIRNSEWHTSSIYSLVVMESLR